jgi:hypothetical protein
MQQTGDKGRVLTIFDLDLKQQEIVACLLCFTETKPIRQ